jgi:hypothetical protein
VLTRGLVDDENRFFLDESFYQRVVAIAFDNTACIHEFQFVDREGFVLSERSIDGSPSMQRTG